MDNGRSHPGADGNPFSRERRMSSAEGTVCELANEKGHVPEVPGEAL